MFLAPLGKPLVSVWNRKPTSDESVNRRLLKNPRRKRIVIRC
jgi:hypothetical protein